MEPGAVVRRPTDGVSSLTKVDVTLVEAIGWLGSTLLAFCGAPQAIKTYRTKQAEDLSWGFLFMWIGGEICTTIYVLVPAWGTGTMQWPLLWAKRSYPRIRK